MLFSAFDYHKLIDDPFAHNFNLAFDGGLNITRLNNYLFTLLSV